MVGRGGVLLRSFEGVFYIINIIAICDASYWIASVVLLSLIIGSSKFYHSLFFAFAKNHSYRTSTQDVLGAFQAHGALAKIRCLEFWRSVGLAFHFEILRISAFHRPTPHGAFTSFSPAKIRSSQ